MEYTFRSSGGQVIQWREHSFPFLGSDNSVAFAWDFWEPQRLDEQVQFSEKFHATSNSNAFFWNLAAESVMVVPIWQGEQLESIPCESSGSMKWEPNLIGCDAVDLVAKNYETYPAAVRLAAPDLIRGKAPVTFAQRVTKKQIVVSVRAVNPAFSHFRVRIVERADTGRWFVGQAVHWLPAEIEMPIGQGAFVVMDADDRIAGMSFYVHGDLRDASPPGMEIDVKDMLEYLPKPSSKGLPFEEWPGIMRQFWIDPAQTLLDRDIDQENPVDALRILLQRRLFEAHLTPANRKWKPEKTVEEFAGAVWPRLQPLLDADLSSEAMDLAFRYKNDDKLTTAWEWAGHRPSAFVACMTTIDWRRVHGVLSPLPLGGDSKTALARLGLALAAVPGGSPDAVAHARDCYRQLEQAMTDEYGARPDQVNPDRFSEAKGLKEMQEVLYVLGAIVAPDIPGCLAELTRLMTDPGLPEGVWQLCTANGLVTDGALIEQFNNTVRMTEVIRDLPGIIPIWYRGPNRDHFERFEAACNLKDIAVTLAVGCLAWDIRESVRLTVDDVAIRAGLRPNDCFPDCGLPLKQYVEAAAAKLLELRHEGRDAKAGTAP